MMISALRKLTRHTPINVIAKKREAADKLIEAENYTYYKIRLRLSEIEESFQFFL